MSQEKIFRSAVDFKTHLKQMLVWDIVFGVSFSIFLLIIIIRPHNFLLFLLGIFFALVSLFVFLGVIISFFLTRKIVKINKKGVQIPVSGFKGFFFREQTGEGYSWNIKGKTILVSSSLSTGYSVCMISSKMRMEEIKTNRALYNLNLTIEANGATVRVKEIPSLLKGISDKTLANSYRKVIEEAFRYNHAQIPQKTVAIKFNEMKPWFPDEDLNSFTKKIAKKFKKIMPKFENIVLYVSVANPGELARELKSRIK